MIKSYLKKTILFDLYNFYKLHKFKNRWLLNNSENKTTVNNIFDPSLVDVGKDTYGELNIITFSNQTRLHIGRFVSIAQEVAFILDAEHYTNHISTYPFKVKYLNIEEAESFSKGDIYVGDDVWIGYRSIIMSGVHIGQGAVIAAGSIVTKDVPPYAIVGGSPAKIIKYRFNQDICDILEKVDFNKFDKKIITDNLGLLYTDIDKKEQIEEFLQYLM